MASVGVALVTLNTIWRERLSDPDPSLSDHGHIPGAEGYRESDAGLSETRILKSFRASGSIGWEDLFDPEGQADEGQRTKATIAIVGFYAIAGFVTVVMAYTGLTWGYHLGLFIVGYATFIIGVNYVKARRRRAAS